MPNMIRRNGKMTRIINRESYAKVLAQYQPKVIETEEENEAAIALAQELEHRERTLEEDVFLQMLLTLIEKFEDQHYQFNASTPQSILNKPFPLDKSHDVESFDCDVPALNKVWCPPVSGGF
jgi:antitoxin component HigA of HigAB toxin-antitoxin module